jgi:hypothetical protein
MIAKQVIVIVMHLFFVARSILYVLCRHYLCKVRDASHEALYSLGREHDQILTSAYRTLCILADCAENTKLWVLGSVVGCGKLNSITVP